MSLADLIERAVAAYGGNQADLARGIRRSPSVVGHWRIGRYTPDFESCLALAQITGDSPLEVLRLAGHDPDRLLEAARRLQTNSQPDPEPEDPTDRKIRRRFRQFSEVVGRYPRAVQLAAYLTAHPGDELGLRRLVGHLSRDVLADYTHLSQLAIAERQQRASILSYLLGTQKSS